MKKVITLEGREILDNLTRIRELKAGIKEKEKVFFAAKSVFAGERRKVAEQVAGLQKECESGERIVEVEDAVKEEE